MSTVKVTVTLDKRVLFKLDELVDENIFKSRSTAVQKAIKDEIKIVKRKQFIEACKKLNSAEEIATAEEGMELDTWPKY